jgi:hypothetical protein
MYGTDVNSCFHKYILNTRLPPAVDSSQCLVAAKALPGHVEPLTNNTDNAAVALLTVARFLPFWAVTPRYTHASSKANDQPTTTRVARV